MKFYNIISTIGYIVIIWGFLLYYEYAAQKSIQIALTMMLGVLMIVAGHFLRRKDKTQDIRIV